MIAAVCINLYVVSFARDYIITPEDAAGRGADCVLVLGAKVWQDGTLSPLLEDRMRRGVNIWQTGAGDRLLLTGARRGEDYDEVGSMEKYALSRGVESRDISVDPCGLCTYDSMYRARDVYGVGTAVVVTQRYHLSRAVYLARKLGIDAVGVSSDLRSYSDSLYDNCREFLARVKAFVWVIFKPEPAYPCDAVPVSGNGEVANG